MPHISTSQSYEQPAALALYGPNELPSSPLGKTRDYLRTVALTAATAVLSGLAAYLITQSAGLAAVVGIACGAIVSLIGGRLKAEYRIFMNLVSSGASDDGAGAGSDQD